MFAFLFAIPLLAIYSCTLHWIYGRTKTSVYSFAHLVLKQRMTGSSHTEEGFKLNRSRLQREINISIGLI